MTEDNKTEGNNAEGSMSPQAQVPGQQEVDPAFFTCVNEYLELTNRQANEHGLLRINMASLFAAARFNAHGYLASVGAAAAAERKGFLDYMTTMYRRMLNEHLDGLGAERGIDVGESELAAEYKAAGVQMPGRVGPGQSTPE